VSIVLGVNEFSPIPQPTTNQQSSASLGHTALQCTCPHLRKQRRSLLPHWDIAPALGLEVGLWHENLGKWPVSCLFPERSLETQKWLQGFPGKINQREGLELTRPNSNGPMVNIPIPIIPTKI